MEAVKIGRGIPPKECLDGERHSEVRHGCIVGGGIHAMAAGSEIHNLLPIHLVTGADGSLPVAAP